MSNSHEWKPYIGDRLILKTENCTCVKDVNDKTIPLFCKICKFLYRSIEDERAHEGFECCHVCAMKWAHPDREKWRSGYRPTQDEVKANVLERGLKMINLK